jgi:hypothetical protein
MYTVASAYDAAAATVRANASPVGALTVYLRSTKNGAGVRQLVGCPRSDIPELGVVRIGNGQLSATSGPSDHRPEESKCYIKRMSS